MKRYKIARKAGKKIRIIRKRKKLTQEEVASRARLHVSTLGRIERAEINTPIQTLNRIAKALGVNPRELL